MVEISEIIVVASGLHRPHGADRPGMDESHAHIRLIVQEKREGKTAAVNLFLQAATEDICVLESGDTLPALDTIEQLVVTVR